MTIHVCVIMNKCGVTVSPQQINVTSSDWKLPREIVVASEVNSEIRTIQIHHKIYETYDELYNSSTVFPSVFVSVLQKEATFLFSFGCGLHGRLGSNDEENANLPTPFACKWLHPVQIASGKAHSAIIDVYSNIYCFGLGASGQLGQGDSNLDSSKIPLRVPTVGTSTILHVACGSHHTMCMTTEGKVFAWGDNACGQLGLGFKSPKPRGIPTRVEKLVNVRSIVCGGSHSFIVMVDNNVLACGSNIAGQLGLGDRKDRATFERVPFFRKLYAPQTNLVIGSSSSSASTMSSNAAMTGDVELACGLYHSMALCGRRVYSWGNGDDGRLGHGNIETYLEPTLISAFNDIPVRAIACGGSHSGVIAVNGDVYLWGNGQHGQLGTGTMRSRRVPTKVRLLQGKHVTQLSFGEWHSMALCEGGYLYSWGFGEEGQLGIPDEDNKHSRIVPYPTIVHALSGTGATMVRCGGSHTFVVSVLEARRSQLARMHCRNPQSEIAKENDRISTLSRPTSLRHQPGVQESESRLLHSRSNSGKESTELGGADELKKKSGAAEMSGMSKKKSQGEKPESSFRNLEESASLRVPVDFSWKARPMTTRAAVRNAFRQEVKAIAEIRESLTPILMPTSRAKTANAFISPRLKRLHEQVLRNTEAGAGLLKCQSIVRTDEISTSIGGAVQIATRAFFNTETVGLSMSLDISKSSRTHGNQSNELHGQQSLAEMLREVRGEPSESSSSSSDGDAGGDAESDESSDVEVIAFGGSGGTLASRNLEREVAWQLSSP